MIRNLLRAFALAVALNFSGPVATAIVDQPAYAQTVTPPAQVQTCARAYTFTGLFGVEGQFSLGVWDEADKIAREFPCVKTYKRRWTNETATYETAKANYRIDGKPIFLIGHSLGANAALNIARRLAADRIPVATVFAYDPTRSGAFAACITPNVQTAIGWRGTVLFNLGRGRIRLCPGNTVTAIEDHPMAVAHVLIDNDPGVHRLTNKHIGEVLHMIEEMKGAQ